MTKDYRYIIVLPKHGESFDDGDSFESNLDDLVEVAEEYADYYHSERDGWESSWPEIFHIYSTLGKLMGEVEVQRESVPEFVGTLKPKQGET